MNHTLVYGDLRTYLKNRRQVDKGYGIKGIDVGWRKFADMLPEILDTPITNETTDKLVDRFKEAAHGNLQDSTIKNYSSAFRHGLDLMLQHVEDTGTLDVPLPAAKTTPVRMPKYSDMGEYLIARREESPDDETARRWMSAYDAIFNRVPDATDEAIDPETTEQIMERFATIASSAKTAKKAAAKISRTDPKAAAILQGTSVLKRNTVSTYGSAFRDAIRFYCEVRKLDYTEVSPEERRRRARARRAEAAAEESRRAEAAAQAAAEAATRAAAETAANAVPEPEPASEAPEAAVDLPADTTAPAAEAAGPQLADYRFLLRPGTVVALSLPDDLTRREADRLSQWISSFVIDPQPEVS